MGCACGIFPARQSPAGGARQVRSRLARAPFARHPQGVALSGSAARLYSLGLAGKRPYTLRAALLSGGVCGGFAPACSNSRLAAQLAAGAASRRRCISRDADRSAAGCADRRTLCGAERSTENHAQSDTACRALAAWHEAERQPGGDAVSAAALTRSRLPRCLRPATDLAGAPAAHAGRATAAPPWPGGEAAARPLQRQLSGGGGGWRGVQRRCRCTGFTRGTYRRKDRT